MGSYEKLFFGGGGGGGGGGGVGGGGGGGGGGGERGWLMASEKLMTVYLLQRIHY